MVHDHRSTRSTGQTTGDHSIPGELLDSMGDGLVQIGADGDIVWCDARFESLPSDVRNACRAWCTDLHPTDPNRTVLSHEQRHYECIARLGPEGGRVCIVMEATRTHGQRLRLDSIDQAGMALLHIGREEIADLDIAQRLAMLEGRIVSSVRSELNFDSFEIRLIEPDSSRLELVISQNLSPMRVGEALYASEEGNGISGRVAATGQAYVCADVHEDPLYAEGLSDARSSLTVPLKLHDRVIGVFNIESSSPGTFDEHDCALAERFSRYVACVLHLLDLLVVERTTTSRTSARNVLAELDRPMTDMRSVLDTLRASGQDDPATALEMAMIDIATRVEACAAGPRSIIDAEYEVHGLEPVEALQGKRILVVDDEQRIRDAMAKILRQLECDATICGLGQEVFAALDAIADTGDYDLVISDIRLPDSSGYEVFTASRGAMPDVPVILMTGFGYDPDHTIVRASADGVQGVLLKPFRTAQLIEAMTNALNVATG